MRIKILETQSGQRYIVSEKNELAQYRYDFSKGGLQRPQFSGNWRLVGFAKVLPFGHIGPDIPPEEVLGQDMKFKNGEEPMVSSTSTMAHIASGETGRWPFTKRRFGFSELFRM